MKTERVEGGAGEAPEEVRASGSRPVRGDQYQEGREDPRGVAGDGGESWEDDGSR